jgi:hypothetical protein
MASMTTRVRTVVLTREQRDTCWDFVSEEIVTQPYERETVELRLAMAGAQMFEALDAGLAHRRSRSRNVRAAGRHRPLRRVRWSIRV